MNTLPYLLAQADTDKVGLWKILLAGIVLLIILVFSIILFNFFFVWLRAMAAGAKVTFIELIALRLRSVPVGLIVDTRITAIKSGLEITIDDLSTHFLAGGNAVMVIQALIAARKAGIHLDFDRACAIDLATKGTGKTVLEAVKTSVNPKVIDCPNPGSGKVTIDAVAKDGIVIKAKARVTVRTNLDRFVGGATEETIIARVGEGIVTTIGSSQSYKDVLENPDRISKTVLDKALDSNTAFEILSIDIADVDVGENVGAKLQAEQAEANKLIAQAQAEVRRATAVALEQEMVARVQEMRARVVEAEAQVPLAMAEAFRSGHLGVMDYYRMKNIQADTGMRESIAGGSTGGASKPPGT
ncbi:MAG TPA: flotillin-like protein FloA [Candidatus Saccharimonadales bacterium]|jgi:uncharacterized protein YqfA (UPF0365 family)|nr:flotillin-like protein FloA [Candidatus Saccharimonadales bacterium]